MITRKHWLLFDADDTIVGVEIAGEVVGTAKAYDFVLDQFARRMAEWGIASPEVALATQSEIDRELAREYGFADKRRFPQSLVNALGELAGKAGVRITRDQVEEIAGLGWEVFNFPYKPLPGATLVMATLAKYYKIAVVTKGEEDEQRKKMFESGLFAFADQIFVLGHKNHEEWDAVISQLRLDMPARLKAWAIGNSVKSDINIPLELGMNAIHLNVDTWEFERMNYYAPCPNTQLRVINSIVEVLDIVPLPDKEKTWN